MERKSNSISMLRFVLRPAAVSSLALGLLCTGIAYGDSPVSLAPPVNSAAATSTDSAVTYSWTAVPENQDVAISRATFDRGGYQLYDDSGDIIVVPFVNNNLFVMKFACSTDGTMYFVRNGNTPVLYLPKGGYLENATVPGARWYPFGSGFEPQTPVSMGIAPTMDDYIDMGWYAGTVCDGGYYGNSKNGYVPCPGYGFNVNGHKYKGWKSYCDYWVIHVPPFHNGYSNTGLHNTPILQWRYPVPPGGRHPWVGLRSAGQPSIASRPPVVIEDHSRDFSPPPAPVVEDHSHDYTPPPAPVDNTPPPAPAQQTPSAPDNPAPVATPSFDGGTVHDFGGRR